MATVIISAVLLGLANHVFFKNFEPRRTQIPNTALILALQPIILMYFVGYTKLNLINATLIFFASLSTSIVLYRISPFHPLARVPGPMAFKVTKWYRAWICWNGKQHHVLQDLHEKYGSIVRTGPNEVSVTDVESVREVLGSNGFPKGHGYLIRKMTGRPGNLISTRGQERVDRRRLWSRGFTSDAIKTYQAIIQRKAAQLGEVLSAEATKNEVDLLQWIHFFAFDFMAELMFGRDKESEMLKAGRDVDGILTDIQDSAIFGEIFSHVPWFTHLARKLPIGIVQTGMKFIFNARAWSARRIERGSETKDLWYHLTDEAGLEKVKPTPDIVSSDSGMAIIAGSDTTASALGSVFWCLMSHPESYKRVREEVDREFPSGVDPLLDTSRHPNMSYLNAVLNESLRVSPPVPTSGPRVVPKGSGGRIVAGHLLPENTQIYVPPYSVHRNPANFSPNPNSFIPERWLDSDPKTTNMNAFIPFSAGPANCVGKNLARLEMLMVLTLLIQKFEFEFAEGFDAEKWFDTKVDAFITLSQPLLVTIKIR